MSQILCKDKKSYSLPKLINRGFSQSKLFHTQQELIKTKKLFIERFESKQQNKNNEEVEKTNLNRSLIQFPKQYLSQEGFVAFKTINKNQKNEIFKQIKKMKSKSTFLAPSIKAEILFNKNQYQKISKANELKLHHEKQFIHKRIKELNPKETKKDKIKINSKLKKKVRNVKEIIMKLNFKEYEHHLYSWKPYIDYDAMVVAIKQQFFFIGGRKQANPVVFNSIQSSWKEIQVNGKIRCFGQSSSSVLDNKKIFCFGGYNYFQSGISLITNELKIIDIKTMLIQIAQFDEDRVPCRAFHSQCLYGKFLIVSGGIDKNNKMFNNFMILHYQKNYWNELTILKMPQQLKQGFAKHEILPIFHQRNSYSVYNDDPILVRDQSISKEGVYMFGGQDANGELLQKLYILKLGQSNLSIEPLNTIGEMPIARRNAKLIKHKEYLIIHGGRNDSMKPSVLNSLDFLNLKTFNWVKVRGQKPPYRYSHAISVIHDEIIIMGGKGLEGLNKQVFIMPYQEIIQVI